MKAKVTQPCLTLCDPIDSSPPGSPVPGILQGQGSQVSMRVARGSASWLSSHGRGLGPRDALNGDLSLPCWLESWEAPAFLMMYSAYKQGDNIQP